ncbi:hypothetical protein NCCP2222_20740 [Sporosarcina sp. NCCP-2222]|nr:hypothetical protein NCCP2222_20740 [Sporosarcina sp. NCCP-2222]
MRVGGKGVQVGGKRSRIGGKGAQVGGKGVQIGGNRLRLDSKVHKSTCFPEKKVRHFFIDNI